MPIAAGDADDFAPRIHVALALGTSTGRQDGAIGKQPESSAPARGHGSDASPPIHIALPVAVPARGNDQAVRSQADRVRPPGVISCMHVARRHRNDLVPRANSALAGGIVAHSEDSPVPATTD
jgi:hypothetical protein